MANHALAGSIPIPQTGASDVYVPGFHPNPQVEFLIDKLAADYEDEYLDIADKMKLASQLRFRDLIAETVHEQSRMQNFCRIYPARQSKQYDRFFSVQKHLNKIIYKVLFTNEILPYHLAGDKSANPTSSKAASFLTQTQTTAMSQDRLHSSSGARPIRT
jgi:hypothetical protein